MFEKLLEGMGESLLHPTSRKIPDNFIDNWHQNVFLSPKGTPVFIYAHIALLACTAGAILLSYSSFKNEGKDMIRISEVRSMPEVSGEESFHGRWEKMLWSGWIMDAFLWHQYMEVGRARELPLGERADTPGAHNAAAGPASRLPILWGNTLHYYFNFWRVYNSSKIGRISANA